MFPQSGKTPEVMLEFTSLVINLPIELGSALINLTGIYH